MAPVRFEWWPDMYERFVKASRVTDPLEDTDRPDVKTLLTDIQREVSFLVIDDIDLGEYTAFKETLLLRLLQVTDGKLKNLVVTMNRGPVEAIPVLGERVVDRLFSDRFFCVHVTGGSLRRKDGRAEMAPPIPGVTGGLF
jgi:DNA replication protein DnaC